MSPSWPLTRALDPTPSGSRTATRSLRKLTAALAARPAAEWAAALTAQRVPAGVVNDIAGAFALAESLGLSPVVEVPSAREAEPGGPLPEPVRLPRNPIGLSRTPPRYRSGPPPLGGGG